MHLGEEQVQRFLHGELAHDRTAATAGHLGACAECRWRVAEAEREERRALELLEHLDHVAPHVDVRTIMSGRRRRGAGLVRWAAGILLVVGAGSAAYAAPGSPLPALVERLLSGGDAQAPTSPLPPNAHAPQAAAEEVTQGIAVTPGDRFTIEFSSPQPAGVAVVTLTDGEEIAVRAVGAVAIYTSDVDRLTIGNAGSARFEIQIPRNARRVDVRVAGRRVFLVQNGSAVGEGSHDAIGRFRVPLAAGQVAP